MDGGDGFHGCWSDGESSQARPEDRLAVGVPDVELYCGGQFALVGEGMAQEAGHGVSG